MVRIRWRNSSCKRHGCIDSKCGRLAYCLAARLRHGKIMFYFAYYKWARADGGCGRTGCHSSHGHTEHPRCCSCFWCEHGRKHGNVAHVGRNGRFCSHKCTLWQVGFASHAEPQSLRENASVLFIKHNGKRLDSEWHACMDCLFNEFARRGFLLTNLQTS